MRIDTRILLLAFAPGACQQADCPAGFEEGPDNLCLQTTGDDTDSDTDADTDTVVDTDTDDDTDIEPPADGDGDGFLPPEDCDDTTNAVYPGHDEICDDGLDNDCDAATVCRWEGNVFVPDASLTGIQGETAAAIDLDGDGDDELVVGANEVNADHVLVYSGSALDGDALVEATYSIDWDYDPYFPPHVFAMFAYGDINGDGIDDLVAGQFDGAVIIDGPVDADRTLDDSVVHIDLPPSGQVQPLETVGLGDWDGDGSLDLAMAEPFFDVGADEGYVSLFLGPVTADTSMDEGDLRISGRGSGMIGFALSVDTDLDGDGATELIALDESVFPIRVFNGGGALGSIVSNDADTRLSSTDCCHVRHAQMISPADLDGDGYGDLAGGMPITGGDSGAYVFYGPLPANDIPMTQADVLFTDPTSGGFGLHVDFRRDLDQDGELDLVVTDNDIQSLHVFYGPFGPGAIDATTADADILLRADSLDYWFAVGDWDVDGDEDISMAYPFVSGAPTGVVDTWFAPGI